MKLIPLTQGQFAEVDDEDFEKFKAFKWYPQWSNSTKSFYASRYRAKDVDVDRNTLLHRAVIDVKDPNIFVDHIDRDTLNCQRGNLRPCTRSQNMMNRLGARSSTISGLRGVSWHKRSGKWQSRIVIAGKLIHLGLFCDKLEAASVYAAANKKHFGEFGGLK